MGMIRAQQTPTPTVQTISAIRRSRWGDLYIGVTVRNGTGETTEKTLPVRIAGLNAGSFTVRLDPLQQTTEIVMVGSIDTDRRARTDFPRVNVDGVYTDAFEGTPENIPGTDTTTVIRTSGDVSDADIVPDEPYDGGNGSGGSDPPGTQLPSDGLVVTDCVPPFEVSTGQRTQVPVTVTNTAQSDRSGALVVRVGPNRRELNLSVLSPGESAQRRATFTIDSPGDYDVQAEVV
jgi:hypothetical protein